MEDFFSVNQGGGGGFRDDSSILYLLCTLFLLLLHKLHLRSSVIRSHILKIPDLEVFLFTLWLPESIILLYLNVVSASHNQKSSE